MMALVFAKNDIVVFVQQSQFYGGGTNVNTCAISLHKFTLFLIHFGNKGDFVDNCYNFLIIRGKYRIIKRKKYKISARNGKISYYNQSFEEYDFEIRKKPLKSFT